MGNEQAIHAISVMELTQQRFWTASPDLLYAVDGMCCG